MIRETLDRDRPRVSSDSKARGLSGTLSDQPNGQLLGTLLKIRHRPPLCKSWRHALMFYADFIGNPPDCYGDACYV